MKSNVGITHPANLCTVAEIIIQTQCYLFAADSLGLSYIRLYTISSGRSWMMLYVTVVQSHSRSLKLIPIGEARMQITIIVHYCDAHYAYLLSFPRLIEKFAFFTAFTHRTFVWSHHRGVTPGIYGMKAGINKLEVYGGAVTSVGWQIILCDPIGKWRPVVLRWISRRTIRSFTFTFMGCAMVNTAWE